MGWLTCKVPWINTLMIDVPKIISTFEKNIYHINIFTKEN